MNMMQMLRTMMTLTMSRKMLEYLISLGQRLRLACMHESTPRKVICWWTSDNRRRDQERDEDENYDKDDMDEKDEKDDEKENYDDDAVGNYVMNHSG